LMKSEKARRAIEVSSVILVLVLAIYASMGLAEAQTVVRVFWDDFEDYEVKTYSGGAGPGPWLQSIGGGGSATYKIVSSGGNKFYSLESSDGVFVKSVLSNYFCLFGSCFYTGPNDYDIYARIKVVDGEGGLIFRVTSDLKKYYLATVYKSSKKMILWYVDEDQGPGAGPKLAEVALPAEVDPSDWFSMRVWVYKDNITVFVAGKKLASVIDDSIGYGSMGFYTYYGGKAYFDLFSLYVLTSEETTTKTVTSTKTATITSTTTVTSVSTTTLAGTGATITETITSTETVTSTVTSGGATTELVTKTVTETVTETREKRVIETVQVTRRAPPRTETVTTTVTQPGGLRCLIATAAFGSELAPQVQALREFRDGFVMKTFAGRNFMTAFNAFYYSWSPYIARAEYENPALRSFIKASIYPLLSSLELSKQAAKPFSAFPEFAVLISGVVASLLIGLVYASPLVVIISMILRWRRRDFRVRPLYLVMAFAAGLALFALAEVLTSPALMIPGSSAIVLSAIALGAITPTKLISSVLGRQKAGIS